MEHGTRGKYVHDRCRCVECTEANTLYQREANARRAALLKENPDAAPHGKVNTYVAWGCRCAPCSKAHSDSMERSWMRRIARRMLEDSQ